jgi:hypothetical protein
MLKRKLKILKNALLCQSDWHQRGCKKVLWCISQYSFGILKEITSGVMNKLFGIVFTILSFNVQAQPCNFEALKAKKDIYQPDYVQLKDAEITYPVTGLVDIHMEQHSMMGQGAAGGGLFAVVEYWVVDAKGKIVYNNIYVVNPKYAPNNEPITDEDYKKYMLKNEKEIRKRKGLK